MVCSTIVAQLRNKFKLSLTVRVRQEKPCPKIQFICNVYEYRFLTPKYNPSAIKTIVTGDLLKITLNKDDLNLRLTVTALHILFNKYFILFKP